MKKGRKVRGVFLRDGQWWIRYACTLGHDHRQSSGDLKTAATEEHKGKRAEMRDARKAGRECCPRLAQRERPVLFDQIAEDYIEYSERSKRSYRDDKFRKARLLASFGGRLATDIRAKDVEDFKATLAESRTVATVNHHLKLLKAMFNRAIRQGRVTLNPVSAVKLFQEHNARNRCLSLSREEEGRLLEALPERLRPLVTVALNTGMRRGELQALRWSDVDFATGTLRIRRDKAGEGRWVALNSAARDALLAVKREQKVLGSYVFYSPEGRFPPQPGTGLAAGPGGGADPRLPVPRLPAHVRVSARHDSWRGPLHSPAGRRVEESGHGATVRSPQPGLRKGRRRADGQEPFRGWNRHENRH
jgi:integrase